MVTVGSGGAATLSKTAAVKTVALKTTLGSVAAAAPKAAGCGLVAASVHGLGFGTGLAVGVGLGLFAPVILAGGLAMTFGLAQRAAAARQHR